ncbi:hypothetical protein CEXT_785371 [Caerostris extrusa]|uniref:Uncharacterized protein n=1 Tax=Caerostris extrusa TaxID=172846 RepID=A0AAV4NVA8_CAEEX|nr:hypothetical protein CEXT_785371 [Caerostris extrusa]
MLLNLKKKKKTCYGNPKASFVIFENKTRIHCLKRSQVINISTDKARKRLNILKFVSDRDWEQRPAHYYELYTLLLLDQFWTMDSSSFLVLPIPILINLRDCSIMLLESSSDFVIVVQMTLCFFESDLPPLSMRRTYCLTKYFGKLTATMNIIELPHTFTLGLTIDI